MLDKPLPDSEVSSYELGKLKLEHEVLEGYFLAPKTYALVKEDSSPRIRNKGLAEVDLKWFIEQYSDIGRITKCTVNAARNSYDVLHMRNSRKNVKQNAAREPPKRT